jgi:Lipase (class 3)
MKRQHNVKTKRLLKTMPAVAMLLSISIASAIDRPGPRLINAEVTHAGTWSAVPTMGSANAQAMQTESEGPGSQPWKGGMFPALFLTASKGAVGTDIENNTGFRYNIENLPETISKTLVYADVDSLKPSDRMIEQGLELARLNGWPVVLESKSKKVGALRSIIRAAFPAAKKINLPANTTAISIEWKDGVPAIRPTDSLKVETTLLPEAFSPMASAREFQTRGVPTTPPTYLAYFAAAAFIDVDHVDQSRGVWDHAYYSNPQSYINKIFGSGVYTLVRDDSSRHWDLWKSVGTSNDDFGFSHPSECIVAWRGTQLRFSNEIDLITDLASLFTFDEKFPNETSWSLFASTDPKGGRGFINMLTGQRSKIHHQLFRNNCALTSVTGHSMGGSMAQLFGTELWSAWFRSGNGGYLSDRFIKNLPVGQTRVTYPDPYNQGNDVTINLLSLSRWPYLYRMHALNPIAPGNTTLKQYDNEVMLKPPNVPGLAVPRTHIYCRTNDLAFAYGKTNWLNFGAGTVAQYGCDTFAPAAQTGTSYSARRANHSIRLWFGL